MLMMRRSGSMLLMESEAAGVNDDKGVWAPLKIAFLMGIKIGLVLPKTTVETCRTERKSC
jgi:hypothetical protein